MKCDESVTKWAHGFLRAYHFDWEDASFIKGECTPVDSSQALSIHG